MRPRKRRKQEDERTGVRRMLLRTIEDRDWESQRRYVGTSTDGGDDDALMWPEDEAGDSDQNDQN